MSVGRNAVANYIGQGWASVVGVIFAPLYVRVLGVETYGLIGVFSVLLAWMSVFDLGLTPTLNREMARLRAGAHTPESIRDLLRSLEVIYTAIAALVVVLVWMGAPWLAHGWLNVKGLEPTLVTIAVRIMGFVVASRWLEQVYRTALQGMQDQVWANGAQAILATLRWCGSYIVIAFVSPTITAFFVWQGLSSVASVVVLRARIQRLLPLAARGARFSRPALAEVRDFARGMFVTSILTLLLTQSDKLVISKLLPLSEFSLYMLASVLAGGLLQLFTPMNTAVYPRLTEQVALADHDGLVGTYHLACEWMSAVIIPAGLLLSVFARPVMLAWTGDPLITQRAAPLLAMLALGMLCNGLMNLPYMLQLAHGWTSLAVRTNLVAVLLIVPAMIFAVPRFGAAGAAAAWLALNAGYLALTAHFMHRRLLPASKWRWYRDAVLVPLAGGAIVAVAIRLVLPEPGSRIGAMVIVALAAAALYAAMGIAIPGVRRSVRSVIRPVLRVAAR